MDPMMHAVLRRVERGTCTYLDADTLRRYITELEEKLLPFRGPGRVRAIVFEPVEPVDVYEPTVAVVVACDADLQTRIGAEHYEDGNPCTPTRQFVTIEDVLRWQANGIGGTHEEQNRA